MASINLHNIVDINIQQEVVSSDTGTYGIITIRSINAKGEIDEVVLFGYNDATLPIIEVKEK